MVAAYKGNAVPDFDPDGNDISWLASKLGRIAFSSCIWTLRILYFGLAAGHQLGPGPNRLLDSVRAVRGAQPVRPKASSLAVAARQCSCRRVLDHDSNRRPLASTFLGAFGSDFIGM